MLACLKREKAKWNSMTVYSDSLPSGASWVIQAEFIVIFPHIAICIWYQIC